MPAYRLFPFPPIVAGDPGSGFGKNRTLGVLIEVGEVGWMGWKGLFHVILVPVVLGLENDWLSVAISVARDENF
jgi:hypothetical protein